MNIQGTIALVGRGFEAAGVAVLVIGAATALVTYLATVIRRGSTVEAYRGLRAGLGRAILLGLEFLVAADIIRSVAIAPTLLGVGILGIIVLIRTFLSLSLEVEIEGRWPWERARPPASPGIGPAEPREPAG